MCRTVPHEPTLLISPVDISNVSEYPSSPSTQGGLHPSVTYHCDRVRWRTTMVQSHPVPGLFPIRERGVNPLSQPLQAHEIEKMSADADILARLLRSYTMVGCLVSSRLVSSRLVSSRLVPWLEQADEGVFPPDATLLRYRLQRWSSETHFRLETAACVVPSTYPLIQPE
jgi:hypothetical protein